jgi:hypothetical protein
VCAPSATCLSACAYADPRVRAFFVAKQEGIAEPLNEYLSAISSHSSYFGSKDVAALLVRLIHGLDIPA